MGKKKKQVLHLGAERIHLDPLSWYTFEPEEQRPLPKGGGFKRIVFSHHYLVKEFEYKRSWGTYQVLSIRRNDGAPILDQKEFKEIKDFISGEGSVAIQVFGDQPLNSEPSLYYFWILPETETVGMQLSTEH